MKNMLGEGFITFESVSGTDKSTYIWAVKL